MGGRVVVGCQGGCERERRIEVIVKIQQKNRGGGRVVGGGGGQGGCERRSEVFFFVEIQTKIVGGLVGVGCQGWGRVWGCQGGCERRI